MEILGIDVGATDIGGAPIDSTDGSLLADVYEIETPDPATPDAITDVVQQIARHFDWSGPVGVGFPAVVDGGVVHSAVNIDDAWVGVNAAARFSEALHAPATVINDADAAGLAEMHFGAGRGRRGKVLVITIGTGLGVALFEDGQLIPNVEFPDVEVNGQKADKQASGRAKQELGLSWEVFGRHLSEYLQQVQERVHADLIILGGGVSEDHDEFRQYLDVDAEIVPAGFRNAAGIVGAALAARRLEGA